MIRKQPILSIVYLLTFLGCGIRWVPIDNTASNLQSQVHMTKCWQIHHKYCSRLNSYPRFQELDTIKHLWTMVSWNKGRRRKGHTWRREEGRNASGEVEDGEKGKSSGGEGARGGKQWRPPLLLLYLLASVARGKREALVEAGRPHQHGCCLLVGNGRTFQAFFHWESLVPSGQCKLLFLQFGPWHSQLCCI